MFGFSPFSGSAFSDIKETNRVAVELTGFTLDVIDDGVGVSAGGNISVDPNDVDGVGEVGTPFISGDANVSAVAVTAQAALGSVLVQAKATTALTSVSAQALLGTANAVVNTAAAVSGLTASGAIG